MGTRCGKAQAGSLDEKAADRVQCRLCGRSFMAITYTHLVRKHGAREANPIQAYLRRFRLSTPYGRETLKKSSDARYAFWDRVGRKWSPPQILAAIRKRHAQGLPLNIRAIGQAKLSPLRNNAVRFFGSWDRAVALAGIEVRVRIYPRWNRAKVIEGLRLRYDSGRALISRATIREDSALYMAGRYYFGSWEAALRAAKIPISRASNRKRQT